MQCGPVTPRVAAAADLQFALTDLGDEGFQQGVAERPPAQPLCPDGRRRLADVGLAPDHRVGRRRPARRCVRMLGRAWPAGEDDFVIAFSVEIRDAAFRVALFRVETTGSCLGVPRTCFDDHEPPALCGGLSFGLPQQHCARARAVRPRIHAEPPDVPNSVCALDAETVEAIAVGVVSPIFASWNQIAIWLRRLEGLGTRWDSVSSVERHPVN